MKRRIVAAIAIGITLVGLFFYVETDLYIFAFGCRTVGEMLLGLEQRGDHRSIQAWIALAMMLMPLLTASVLWSVGMIKRRRASDGPGS
jgi:hypothetical protein